MTLRDFSSVTEYPGRKVGRDQLEVICRRYAFATQFVEGKRVLEVGCGPGFGLGLLAAEARLLVGGDVTAANVARARATYQGRRDVRLLHLDAQALPFVDRAFDVVLAMAVIYYLDFEVFLRECWRVLVPGGTVIFCTPNKDIPGFRPSRLSTAYYSVPELMTAAKRQRFEIEIFGAFRALEGMARLRQRLIAIGGSVLAFLAFVPGLRDRLRRLISGAIGYELYPLDGQLTEMHIRLIEDIDLIPLSRDTPNFTHRVLYGIGRRREATGE